MAPHAYFDTLSDDLLIKILWHSQHLDLSRETETRDSDAYVKPRISFSSENPYGDGSQWLFQQTGSRCSGSCRSNRPLPAPSAAAPPDGPGYPVNFVSDPFFVPPALTDPAYNLLLASVCARWRRLARRQISTLIVKKNNVVPVQALAAAVSCFPCLTHLHLCESSVDTVTDAFLAHLAATCPNLTVLHVGKEINSDGNWDPKRRNEHPVTDAGLARFFRRCTKLQHLSLYCLHRKTRLLPALSQLKKLHTLALRHSSTVKTPGFAKLSSLTALSLDLSADDDVNLASLARLPAFAWLSLCDEAQLILEEEDEAAVDEASDSSPAFSFLQLPWLKSLEFQWYSPPFHEMLPLGSSCSRLERLLLKGRQSVGPLPNDIGMMLLRLKDLTLCYYGDLSELPEQFSSLGCLERLAINGCQIVSLPRTFGQLPALKSLSLQLETLTNLSDSFHRLSSLETLNLVNCKALRQLPARFGQLAALESLCIHGSPGLDLPEDIGGLTNLRTFHLSRNTVQQLLPSSFTQLSSLTRLGLVECNLSALPPDIGLLRSLRELSIKSFPEISQLPESLTRLLGLESLEVTSWGSDLPSIPKGLNSLGLLKKLTLSKDPQLAEIAAALPGSLEVLTLGSRRRLTPLIEVPALTRLRELSLTSVGCMRGSGRTPGMSLPSVEQLTLFLLEEAEELPLPLSFVPRVKTLTIESAGRLKKLPADFGAALQQLRQLVIDSALELTELPGSITKLRCLKSLEIHAPNLLSLPHDIGSLPRLCKLNLAKCSSLGSLPASLTQLSLLHELNLSETSIRRLPQDIARLSRLRELDLGSVSSWRRFRRG